MKPKLDVVVVGAGIGGLCAAIDLAAAGLRVLVIESATHAGGKAGTAEVDGVEFDTGPSVLTLTEVFEKLFARAGRRFEDQVALIRPEPAFRYAFADGKQLDLYHDQERTLESIQNVLGQEARSEFVSYLTYARAIWEAAAPSFVFAEAPSVPRMLISSVTELRSLARIDPLSSMRAAIERRISSPHLRQLLFRFATYNGSDVRRAPATLGCIAHVELSLGGFGVRGGMSRLVVALRGLAEDLGVSFRFASPVVEIIIDDGRAAGVVVQGGERVLARQVVINADVGALSDGTIRVQPPPRQNQGELSMSAHCGLLRARRMIRSGHTVLFAEDYTQEFADIFDHGRVPRDPTIYLCAQEISHERRGWQDEEPVFVMVNAPSVAAATEPTDVEGLQQLLLSKLARAGLALPTDRFVWWRTPGDLAARFVGSQGALYGPASNDRSAAFRRAANRFSGARGIYLASGSAHPGGGVPLVAQSGVKAAELALRDRSAGR